MLSLFSPVPVPTSGLSYHCSRPRSLSFLLYSLGVSFLFHRPNPLLWANVFTADTELVFPDKGHIKVYITSNHISITNGNRVSPWGGREWRSKKGDERLLKFPTFQQISLDSTKSLWTTPWEEEMAPSFSRGWVPSGNPWLTWSTEEAAELQPRVNASTWMLATEEFKLTSEHPTICIILIRGEWQRAKNDVLDKLSPIENMGYFFYEYQVWSILIYPRFNSPPRSENGIKHYKYSYKAPEKYPRIYDKPSLFAQPDGVIHTPSGSFLTPGHST